jgi:hypothetical protein
MFPERVIADGSLRAGPNHFAFDVRLPWYRALPLSSVDIVDLKVDGASIDPGDVTFLVNDQEYPLDALRHLYDDWWFVAEPAGVRVGRDGGLEPGAHEIDLTLGMYIPYIVFGEEVLEIKERCVKTMTAAWRIAR